MWYSSTAGPSKGNEGKAAAGGAAAKDRGQQTIMGSMAKRPLNLQRTTGAAARGCGGGSDREDEWQPPGEARHGGAATRRGSARAAAAKQVRECTAPP